MKKLIFAAALFLASFAADAQDCIQFKVAGANLDSNLPTINERGTQLTFNYSVVIYIEKIGVGKFEKVDNTTFSIPVAAFNPLTVTEVMNDSAAVYVSKNYPNIK